MDSRCFRYFVFLLFCVFMFPLVSHSLCDYQRISELTNIASNVQFSYNYVIDGDASFDLNITNITNDIYIVDSYNNVFSGSNEIVKHYSRTEVPGFSSGTNVRYNFYSNDPNCRGEEIVTRYVYFPRYNQYANTEACKINQGFKYCGLWIDTSGIDDITFNDEYLKYVNESSQNNVIDNENVGFLGKVYDFISTNLILVLVLMLAFIILLLFYAFKKIKRKREVL